LRRDIEASTLKAYQETEYQILGPVRVILRVGVQSPELALLHHSRRTQCSAFITACNPLGTIVTDAVNAERQAALAEELTRQGRPAIPGIGRHPTGNWPGEPSYWVPGLTREAAQNLGTQFQQNAIIWAGSDAVPELILLR
jgi:hypothetical protein